MPWPLRPQLAETVQRTAREAMGIEANIDFALATLVRALDLDEEAGFAIFAIGRTAGWIAHAQEQYATPGLIRPRASYVGQEPQQLHPPRLA